MSRMNQTLQQITLGFCFGVCALSKSVCDLVFCFYFKSDWTCVNASCTLSSQPVRFVKECISASCRSCRDPRVSKASGAIASWDVWGGVVRTSRPGELPAEESSRCSDTVSSAVLDVPCLSSTSGRRSKGLASPLGRRCSCCCRTRSSFSYSST